MALPSAPQGSGVSDRPAKVKLEAPSPHPAYGPWDTCCGCPPLCKHRAGLVCQDPGAGSVWHICSRTHPKGDIGTHHAARNGGEATGHHSVDF